MRRRNRYLLHIWGYIVPTLPFPLESVFSLLIAYCFHLLRPYSHYYALLLTIITLLPCYLLTLFPVTLLPCYPVILLPRYPGTFPAQCYPVTLFFILCIGVRAGGARGAAAPPNFEQLGFFGQQEKIWAKPGFKDVFMFFFLNILKR